MKITNRIIMSLALLLGTFLAQSAHAHNYLAAPQGSSVTTIPDISVSRASYRTLSRPGQVDIYEFTARKGQELYIQMTVPLLDRQHDFAPELALVFTSDEGSPFGEPAVAKGSLLEPPHDIVDQIHPHQGGDEAEPAAIAVGYDGSEPLVFNEPFTGTRYWIRQTLTVTAPADGTYRIGVYSRDGSTGKYVLAPGKREQFGAGDILSLPLVRFTVRSFCEEPLWPDYLAVAALGAIILGGIGAGILIW
jgi:hypothetical protein